MARTPRTPPKNPPWFLQPDDAAYLLACRHSPKECLDIALRDLPNETSRRIVSYWWTMGYNVMGHPGIQEALANFTLSDLPPLRRQGFINYEDAKAILTQEQRAVMDPQYELLQQQGIRVVLQCHNGCLDFVTVP